MSKSARRAKVYHADLWGLREEKYAWLQDHSWKTTDWHETQPASEFYLFVPRDIALQEGYRHFIKVTDIFSLHSVGIVTARDSLTIRWTPEEVWTTVLNFSRLDPELARQAYGLGNKVSRERILRAQEDLKKAGPSRNHVVPILYRPFDVRYTYYTGTVNGFHERPRPEVMRHMLAGENLALVTARRNRSAVMDHFLCSQYIVETKCGESTIQSYTFPLYLYPYADQEEMFVHHDLAERQSNLNPSLVAALAQAYGQEPSPEEIFQYVYALLYAPTYREKYAEFLRLDFPRIPFTSDYELSQRMDELGKRLVDLHLLRSPELDPPIARFQGEGDGKVIVSGKKGLRYDAPRERVYISETQHFEGVPPEVWEYQIGGYQVCHKWLKDRADRKLSLDDIRTYCRIATTLSKTLEVQRKLEEVYSAVEEVHCQTKVSRAGHSREV